MADVPALPRFLSLVGGEDAGFGVRSQWIILWGQALSGCENQERTMPELAISTEKVGFLIEKARQFDAKEFERALRKACNSTESAFG